MSARRPSMPLDSKWLGARLRRRHPRATRNGLDVPVHVAITEPTPDLCAELRLSMLPYRGGQR